MRNGFITIVGVRNMCRVNCRSNVFGYMCSKVNSVAYLKAIEELGATVFGNMLKNPIDGQYPLDTALKTMVISL